MDHAMREAARQLARATGRSAGREIRLLSRAATADEFGRIESATAISRSIGATIHFVTGTEVEAHDGALTTGDCILFVDSRTDADLSSDQVSIDGVLFRIVKSVPDTAGALKRWHCRRIT